MGQFVTKDTKLFRHFFKEQAKLLGIHVLYQYPIDMEYTLHGQEDPKGYSDYIEMDIIFDTSPKLNTLKKLGWVSEVPEDKPYLVQLPFDAPNLKKGCLITLPAPLPISTSKVFKITEITFDQVMPDSWYCKLAPKFEEMNALTEKDYKDKPYSFLKIDDGPV